MPDWARDRLNVPGPLLITPLRTTPPEPVPSNESVVYVEAEMGTVTVRARLLALLAQF